MVLNNSMAFILRDCVVKFRHAKMAMLMLFSPTSLYEIEQEDVQNIMIARTHGSTEYHALETNQIANRNYMSL
jgi:hypothetical protein